MEEGKEGDQEGRVKEKGKRKKYDTSEHLLLKQQQKHFYIRIIDY